MCTYGAMLSETCTENLLWGANLKELRGDHFLHVLDLMQESRRTSLKGAVLFLNG